MGSEELWLESHTFELQAMIIIDTLTFTLNGKMTIPCGDADDGDNSDNNSYQVDVMT